MNLKVVFYLRYPLRLCRKLASPTKSDRVADFFVFFGSFNYVKYELYPLYLVMS